MDDAQRQRLEEATRFQPGEVEARIFAEWIDGGYFHPEAEGKPEDNFSVAIPIEGTEFTAGDVVKEQR